MCCAAWKIIFSPREYFYSLKANPRWGHNCILITLLQIIFTAIQIILSFPSVRAFNEREVLLDSAALIMLISLRNVLTWFFASLVLFNFVKIAGATKNFSLNHSIAVIVSSHVVQCLALAFSILIGYARVVLSRSDFFDPADTFSLSTVLFFDSPDYVRYVLSKVDIFTIWYIVLVSKGVFTLSSIGIARSYCMTAIVFLFGVSLRLMLLNIFTSLPSLILK